MYKDLSLGTGTIVWTFTYLPTSYTYYLYLYLHDHHYLHGAIILIFALSEFSGRETGSLSANGDRAGSQQKCFE